MYSIPVETSILGEHGTLAEVLRIWRGAIYVRIMNGRTIDGGCSCQHCKAHPKQTPTWDVLSIPLTQGAFPWTVHAPEWSASDNPKA